MLYVCVGDHFTERKAKVDSLCQIMQTKRPDALFTAIETTTHSLRETIEQNMLSSGLFDEKTITKALGVCEEKDVKDYIFTHLEELAQSPNAFILSEQSLSKTELKKITDAGGEVFEFNLPTKQSVNLFYLGDLLLKKNKSKLWISIQEEQLRGVSTEELFGILLWQTKSLHIALTQSLENSQLKPFVYKKCKSSLWSPAESQKLHFQLVRIYHQARHKRVLSLQEQLEKNILSW